MTSNAVQKTVNRGRSRSWQVADHRRIAPLITPYPPGIPVLAPGEAITEPIVDYLEEIVPAGAFLEGAVDQALDSFRVVAE